MQMCTYQRFRLQGHATALQDEVFLPSCSCKLIAFFFQSHFMSTLDASAAKCLKFRFITLTCLAPGSTVDNND